MDIIFPLGLGSLHNDIELRFSLRSIQKHLTGYSKIYIIGHCPSWIQNIIHLPAADKSYTENKESNIFNKILIACNHPSISNNFLFFNDDHFILKNMDASQFPYFHKGLMTTSGRQPHEPYYKTLDNTIRLFPATNNFDVHCPIIYNKQAFASMQLPFPPYGYCIKTLYCNHQKIKGELCEDLKITKTLNQQQIAEVIQNRIFFSIGNSAFAGEILKTLHTLYPQKSIYEK